ncbi:MAG: hypothetical protein ACF8GE_06840 [Phycisphaerales bacterium JB043]
METHARTSAFARAARCACAMLASLCVSACAHSGGATTTPQGVHRATGSTSALLFVPRAHHQDARAHRIVHERQQIWYGRRDALLGIR